MNEVAPALSRVLGMDCCTGCGACAAVSHGAVAMRMTATGFLRPHQTAPVSDRTDAIIADICPGIGLAQGSREGDDHPLWGPLIALRTGASTDGNLHHHASSGGALSGLLVYLLETGTVERVVQVAASAASPIENATVESLSADDVYQAAGSRYAPSAPLSDLDRQLSRPGKFAFVGKPCDVAALRALGRHDARVVEKVAMLLSFFCAGIPSLHGTRAILDRLNVVEPSLDSFRYRGDGWPGRCTATLRDGSKASMSYEESWGDILTKHVQFRCKICPDGSGGFADVVCGDAWHCGDDGRPLFEEAPGRSLIISRTARGEALVRQAIAANYLTAEAAGVEEIEGWQPSQASRKRLVLARLAGMAAAGRGLPRFRGLNLTRGALAAGMWPNARNFLGMLRRLLSPSAARTS